METIKMHETFIYILKESPLTMIPFLDLATSGI